METPSDQTDRNIEEEPHLSEESREPEPEDAAASPQAAPDEGKQPGAFTRGATAVLGNETRFGRFMRAALRLLATVVGLFTLGLLAAYLLLYRPAQQQLAQTRSDLAQTRQQLQTAEADLVQAKKDLATMQGQNQDLTEQLKSANAHVLLLQVHEDVNSARLALAEDNPSAARQALAGTQELLDQLAPTLDAADPDLATTLKTRLDLVTGEMSKDPEIAASDLTIVSDRLREAEGSLFK